MFSMIFFIVMILMSVAFLTLFELHLMGLSQIRFGPDKNSMMGFLQFIFDGLKLLKKEVYIIFFTFKMFFIIMPMMFFFYFWFFWLILNFFNLINLMGNFLFFMCLIGLSVYFFIFLGIFSKSKYSILGSIRASSQTLSFEILWFFLMMFIMINFQGLNFYYLNNFMLNNFILIYFLSILLEVNRTPFDFFESESELVSGYNTEYFSFFFVFLILSEYGLMIFFSLFFFNFFFNSLFIIYLMLFFILFTRTVFPRFRYDKMMSLFWLNILPFILILLIFYYMNFMMF